MVSIKTELCFVCSKPLLPAAYFCGGCLTQFKCKVCDGPLEKDYAGCTNCGTPKSSVSNPAPHIVENLRNLNTFSLHETQTERRVEATFSDIIGKDLAGILGDAYRGRKAANPNGAPKTYLGLDNSVEDTAEEFAETEVEVDSIKMPRAVPEVKAVQAYPTLKAISMKNLPASETEWLVVYGFYSSVFGEEIFTRKLILEKYTESNRASSTRARDLGVYLKRAVNANYINPLDNGFSMLEEGIKKAKEIITRTSGSAPKYKSSSKEKSESGEKSKPVELKKASNGRSLKRITDLNLSPSGKTSLKDYFAKYSPRNDFERYLVCVSYMQDVIKISNISYDHIYTCLDSLDLKISESLLQTVRNSVRNKGWLIIKNKAISTTVKGDNQIKEWNKK